MSSQGFERGKFYYEPELEHWLVCEDVAGDTATMLIVESYFQAKPIMARFRTEQRHSCLYEEVRDAKKIGRLRRLYASFLASMEEGHPRRSLKRRHYSIAIETEKLGQAPLEERFFDFARSGVHESEEIDSLELTREQRAAKRADFFFEDRRIICECKSFKTAVTTQDQPDS